MRQMSGVDPLSGRQSGKRVVNPVLDRARAGEEEVGEDIAELADT